ncbi:uncharacterized protein LOC134194528 isoform X2 [Corticium candelabrum]|uniref:uncharacterized protein LOC134194528 isoform X2 n=1 Tax=Corticium candelabrum TaxID=121492 RepID=UPI002E26A64F|nr:uncharacterized protein LOC134194528 isoform X2 [Corticium candelabrum]
MLTAKRLPSGKPPRKRLACPSCALLTLVISLAIIVASLAILLLYDVATPPLSNTFLSQRDFPQGQRLRQKTRRVTKLGASCDGFGVQRELFFHKFGGVHCALVAWESADEYEEEDRYIARLETVYKVFASNVSADEYFTKFWGTHLYDHLPPYLYVDQSDSSPLVGQQTRAFRWDSSNVRPGMPVPLQAASTPPHIIFLFREGRFFVRILMRSFPNGRDARMSSETAGSLGRIIVDTIRRNEPSERRKMFVKLQADGRSIVFGGMRSVTSELRSLFKYVRKRCNNARKWICLRMWQIYSQLITEDFGSKILVIRDARLLFIAVVVLLHNRFHAFLKPYSQMSVSHLRWLTIVATAIDRSQQNQPIVFANS